MAAKHKSDEVDTVEITYAYNKDLSLIGTTAEVDRDLAALLVREGRAVLSGKSAGETLPGAAPLITVGGGDSTPNVAAQQVNTAGT